MKQQATNLEMKLRDCCRPLPFKVDVSLDNKGLKHRLHRNHDKWQKYGVALKRVSPYIPAIATTYDVSEAVYESVVSSIPGSVLSVETPVVWYLEVDGGSLEDSPVLIPPHVDDFRVCTINFYLEASGEVTSFHNYNLSKINDIGSFSAKSGECWILNTNVPHSVKLVPGRKRQVLGLSFIKTPYDIISSLLP
jgi:hypothetical protein